MDNNEQNSLIPQNKIKIYRLKNKQREGTKLVQQQKFCTRVNLSSVLSSCLVPPSRMLLAVMITFRLKMTPFWEMGLIFVSLGY